ncbi:tetratricopeptide repeat protein [Wolbachia endosymbiont of Pentalonia nigronervosa]|uniref:FxSxx-COOH system tetratricopeptide repeat protein n=1 Tax=Wolbachia endosymbiont of Pentalonia nigronervosa TaxID=1301914 RepID=UPI00165F6391|nr:FxSxx-COOH system tetratricopeptide repeat protein [Wolbachia endosymbiont of Pentalonia nigronervosa]MBD0391647.1 tetratricopeptide repeat protein [Wolbachia endosymbiont of Pentalonia nigronervosa]
MSTLPKFNIKFDVKEPVASFTGRVQQLKELHTTLTEERKTVVAGLGGVGKSELARKYISEYSKNYDNNIIWINAESYQILAESFLSLAQDKLEINVKSIGGSQKDIKSIVEDVYVFFSKRKSLFIFDNTEKLRTQDDGNEGIDKFLPSLPSNANKPYILITSRNQSWGNIKRLSLETFTQAESIEFIKKALKIEDNAQNQGIARLAETLQHFPLTLQQAVAYIAVKDEVLRNVGSEFKISDYLKRYEEKTKELLKFPFPEDSDNTYTKTTFITWEVTLDGIKQKENGDKAIEILNIISYFAPENISTNMFLSLIKNQEDLGSAVHLLKQYSMVSSGQEQTTLNIHRLVQQVTRIELTEQNKAEIIGKAFDLLEKNFPYGSDRSEDYPRKQKLLPHLEAFLSHLDDWLARKPEDKQKIETSYLEVLLGLMANGYANFGDYRRMKELLERALEIKEKHYGRDHVEFATTLENLGNAYGFLDDPNKCKELLERALAILEKHYGPDHVEFARTLGNLGLTYGALGDPNKQKELLEWALAIKEKHYGPDHFEVARTLENLGNAYGTLGDLNKTKKLLERALAIQEKHYGPDHGTIAITLGNLGLTYGALGDPNKQKELLEQALAIQEKHYGPDHFKVARTLKNLGFVYRDLGDFNKEKELFEQALAIQKKHYGPDYFEVARTLVNLGNVYGILGDFNKQKELLEQALAIQEKYYSPDHFEVARTLVNLGNVYGIFGDFNKTKELLERALPILEKHYGPDHFEVAMAIKLFTQAKKGDLQKVEDYIKKGAVVNAKDKDGRTPLHYAVQDGYKEIVEILLKNGAHYDVKDSKGRSPLDLAKSSSSIKVLLDCIDNLFKAVQGGTKDEVDSLLEGKDSDTLKAILNARNTDNKTLLQVASVNKQRRDIADFLLNKLKVARFPSQQEEATHQEGEISAKECLPSTSHRKKREAENECLFTWEDVDEFNEEKDEKRSLSNIEIDSEKFISYVKDLPQEKRDQLIQLAGEVKVTGQSQGLINKLISNQKFMNHLNKVGMVSGITMHGMMGKATLASFLNHDYEGVAINLGFIAGGQGFAKVAEAASFKGLKLASEGKLLLGKSLRAASPFLARGTSAFIIYDLVNQVKAFKNGTKEALVGVVGDSIYLGVDSAEIGIEIAEAFEVLEGVSSVTGPIGAVIGAVVFVGTDVYMAVKRVDKIDQLIHLTGKERFVEDLRAFIGMQPEQYIKELMEEKQLYNQLVKQGFEYLKQHSDIQSYVFPIGQKVDLDSTVLLDRKRTDIKWSRVRPDNPDEGQVFCVPQGNYEPAPSYGSYLCKNAIGLSANKTGNHTLISLEEGKDYAKGFLNSQNIFVVNNGSKEYYGGNKDDIFVLQADFVNGYLSGEGGVNTLDITSFAFKEEPLNIQLDIGEIADFSRSNWLKICEMNKIIGRKDKAETITVSCDGCNSNVKLIDGQSGKKEIKDRINIMDDSCNYQMQIIVRSNTVVYNRALKGSFNYVVPLNNRGSAELSFIYGPERFDVNNKFWFAYEPVDIKSIDVKYVNVFNRTEHEVKFNFIKSDKEFNITISYPENPLYMLGNNGEIRIGSKDNLYMLQNSNESAEEIIRNYLPIANRLSKMSFFIQSLLSNETVVIGSGNYEVIHNNPQHKSHLVGNGGENVYVIDSEDDKFPEVIIHDIDEESSIDTIDLRNVVKKGKGSFELQVIRSENDLLLRAAVEKQVGDALIKDEYFTVRLKDGVERYNKTHVIVESIPMRINVDNNEWSLRPQPLIFKKDKEVIIVTNQDIEENTKLITPRRAGNYTFVRDHGSDLIITNAFNTQDDLCTIVLSKFYVEPKMETLSIKFADKEIVLKENWEEISKAKYLSSIKREHQDKVYKEVFGSKNMTPEVMMLSDQPVMHRHRHEHSRYHIRNRRSEDIISSGTRPSTWINDLFSWVKSSVGGLLYSRAVLPEETSSTTNSISQVDAPIDVNSTIMLLDILVRKITGQKYVSTTEQSVSSQSLLEAQANALNITNEFEKVVKQAASKSEISIHRLNINFMKIHDEITEEIIGGKFNEISGILKSHIEKACPDREAGYPGKLSPKKFDKFKGELNKGLDATLKQSKQEILHSKDSKLEVSNVKGSLKPRSDLNNTYIQGYLTQARDVRLG